MRRKEIKIDSLPTMLNSCLISTYIFLFWTSFVSLASSISWSIHNLRCLIKFTVYVRLPFPWFDGIFGACYVYTQYCKVWGMTPPNLTMLCPFILQPLSVARLAYQKHIHEPCSNHHVKRRMNSLYSSNRARSGAE